MGNCPGEHTKLAHSRSSNASFSCGTRLSMAARSTAFMGSLGTAATAGAVFKRTRRRKDGKDFPQAVTHEDGPTL